MGSLGGQSKLPPVLDFSAFRGGDQKAKAQFLQILGEACRDKGFFQLTNHGVAPELQDRIFAASKELFDLPLDVKMEAKLEPGKSRRGYGMIGGQMLEPGAHPDTKEFIYLGEDFPSDHPRVLAGEFGCDANLYPACLGESWHSTCMEYYRAMAELARDVMRALAAALNISEDFFSRFTDGAESSAATLRLVHYPPTPRDDADLARGCGAHRDFGCITLLLQDGVGGLQVQDEETGEFLDIPPVPGAYVVNLGNLMARWTNHHYTSNTHRVLNFSPKDRYSVPFFYNGNARHVLQTIPGLETRPARGAVARPYGPVIPDEAYGPVSVTEFLKDQFVQSYKRAEEYQPKAVEAV